jgi:hypothetical protein
MNGTPEIYFDKPHLRRQVVTVRRGRFSSRWRGLGRRVLAFFLTLAGAAFLILEAFLNVFFGGGGDGEVL